MKSTIPKNILLCVLFLSTGLQFTMAQKIELPKEKQALLSSGKKTTTFFYDETADKLIYDGESWPSEHAERVFTRLPEAGDAPSLRVSAEPPRSIILRQNSYTKSARWWFSNFNDVPKKENGLEAYEFQVTFTIRDHFAEDTKYPLQFHIGNSPKGYWYLYIKNDGQLEVGTNGNHTGDKWKDLYHIKKSNRVKPFKQHTLRFVWFSDGTYYFEFDHYKKYSTAHKDEDSRTLPFIGLSNRVNFNTLIDLHRVVVQQVKSDNGVKVETKQSFKKTKTQLTNQPRLKFSNRIINSVKINGKECKIIEHPKLSFRQNYNGQLLSYRILLDSENELGLDAIQVCHHLTKHPNDLEDDKMNYYRSYRDISPKLKHRQFYAPYLSDQKLHSGFFSLTAHIKKDPDLNISGGYFLSEGTNSSILSIEKRARSPHLADWKAKYRTTLRFQKNKATGAYRPLEGDHIDTSSTAPMHTLEMEFSSGPFNLEKIIK